MNDKRVKAADPKVLALYRRLSLVQRNLEKAAKELIAISTELDDLHLPSVSGYIGDARSDLNSVTYQYIAKALVILKARASRGE